MKVGVLALQGDFEAHARALAGCGATPVEVRTPDALASVDALVIPGGESTTIRKLASSSGLIPAVCERAREGMPILGTCAGMIVCATEIAEGDDPVFPLADITVRRNAYGRQVNSFEADVDVAGIGSVRAAFIRAPRVERVGDDVTVIGAHRGEPVAVRHGHVTLLAFHPEITGDARIHAAFVSSL